MNRFTYKGKLRWKVAQAAEIRWWQNYLRKKDPKEYLAWKKQYWREFLDKLNVSVPVNAKVLDAGCGPAGIFTILNEHEVTAIDPLLDQYQNKLAHFQADQYPNCTFQNIALEALPTKARYDWVFCLNAINHVDDIELAMDRLLGVLNPSGTLVLSIDAHNKPWLKRIFSSLPGDILHPHQYTLSEYQQMLEVRELKIDQTELIDKQFIFNYYVLIARFIKPNDET